MPLTVGTPVRVFVPELEKVRLLNVEAVARVWATPPKFTVPVPALKFVPVPLQAVALVEFSLRVLESPFKVPAVSVTSPVKVWVRPVPRLIVPPEPLMFRAPPLTLPVSVAVPPVLVIDTVPVVVKPTILCVAVPAIVIVELPAVSVPVLVKSPPRVRPKFAVANVTPVIVSEPLTTVAELKVFVPELENVRLLNVVVDAERVWAAPPKFTVPVPALKLVPVPPQAVALVEFSLSVLEPPFKVPAVRVTSPVKV